MRRLLSLMLAALLLTVPVLALEVPEEAGQSVPPELLESVGQHDSLLSGGMSYLGELLRGALSAILRSGARSAVLLMLLALFCGALDGLGSGAGEGGARFVPYAAILGASLIAAGDLSVLIGLGAQTAEELGALSKLLLPTVAAAIATGGFVGTASAWQVGTLMAVELLLSAINELLLPLVYCYVALAAAGAILPKSHLDSLAGAVKKLISWGICGIMLVFTAYLTLSNVLTGSADRLAVKAGSLLVSSAVPIVGGILSEATEAVLSSAGALRGTVGTLGIFAVLSVCLVPLLRLGVQFLFYQAAAFLSAMSGVEPLQKFIERLSGAFTLIFALTASCALLLLVALLVSITMVVAV